MTTKLEREQTEAAEHRQRYLADRPSPLRRLLGPGRRPDEIARLEQQAKLRAEAAEQGKVERQARAAEVRENQKRAFAALVSYRSQLAETLGRARFDLEQATASYDIVAATEAGGRYVSLLAAQDALKKREGQIEQTNLGKFGPIAGAERI